ncbi:hypothetical protein [Alkalicoccobacillus plakortidis]|uniref:DUF3168 domain-containing protein n=1 Tax=Alkalicoccobacillus plakortidis TaxID=444060 RepID=A0ABT0XIN7_9BACI|nr:hypothetical protein [Alkalicoccobacillus plakortidis]MCM2675580.1 hypothetical protein [Alkalicoccobacillus plakortidis]
MNWDIYNALAANPVIKEKVNVNTQIKFYKYPATGDFSGCYIIIDPITTPSPNSFGGNKWITKRYLYQIEVWSSSLTDRDLVAEAIEKVLWDSLEFRQSGDGLDEYDEGLKIYRDARRYRGVKHVI